MCGREKRKNDWVVWSLFAVATLLAGCEYDASSPGTGGPGPACTLDFRITEMNLDLDPDSAGLQTEGILIEDQPFAISWSWNYSGEEVEGIHIGPYEYMTRIWITEGEDIIFETEFASEPVDVPDFDWDVFEFEDGLPAGNYKVQVLIDSQGDVPECHSLWKALNDWDVMELTVLDETLDEPSLPGGR